MLPGPLVTCGKCGWVSIGVPLQYARDAVDEFNEYYDLQSRDTQELFGRRASLSTYLGCWCGSSYRDGRDYKQGDCPDGVTIGPILHYNEVYDDKAEKATEAESTPSVE